MNANVALGLRELTASNGAAAFNRLAGFDVITAADGRSEIRMPWNDGFTQYQGHLHAGVIAALLDTACGFAAATVAGPVTASHFSMNCMRPAVGRNFVAIGTTIRAGRKQVFARADLFAEGERGDVVLVATGETVLVPIAARQ